MQTEAIREFCKKNDLKLMVLFGSRSTGSTHSVSDVDIAVLPERGAEVSKLELIFQLQELVDDQTVDLVILSDATDPLLLHEIFSKGAPLYEAGSGLFLSERIRAWKLYLDTAKIRAMRKQYLMEYVRRLPHVA